FDPSFPGSKTIHPDHPLTFLSWFNIKHPDYSCILPFLVQRQCILTIFASFLSWFKTFLA
ncbi:hypothetical protein, partial [Sphingobacterium hotanense]|uniref:hypothetical protein n=1 Tax=Sphingobacterium hotanense TaxID=649196 RepID=UPI002577C7B5